MPIMIEQRSCRITEYGFTDVVKPLQVRRLSPDLKRPLDRPKGAAKAAAHSQPFPHGKRTSSTVPVVAGNRTPQRNRLASMWLRPCPG
jgi:hypothetical protein